MLKPFIVSILLFFMISQCSDNGIKPPDENGLCEITDTTSHAFSWYTDTLGVWPSVLYDVSAVDENNVWAVGEIELETGRFNAVKWNGSEYEYKKIFYKNGLPRIDIVLAFPEAVWMFADDRFHYMIADSFISGNIKSGEAKGSTRAAWGISTNNFFIVGDYGSITHYDGSSFTLMESGSDVDLHAVTGYTDPKSGLTHAWAAGRFTLLYYDGVQWQTVWDEDNPLLPDNYNYAGALYAPTPRQLLIAAYRPFDIRGYCINTSNPGYFEQLFVTDFYPYAMDGTGINDVFIVGSSNSIAHFNGNSIMKYPEANSGSNRSVSYINNNVYIVGPLAEQLGLFIRGVRY